MMYAKPITQKAKCDPNKLAPSQEVTIDGAGKIVGNFKPSAMKIKKSCGCSHN